jgi:hypothetical protein
MHDFGVQVQRNLRGIELEKSGRVDDAVQLYEENIRERFEGNHPYDRLAIIYRKRKQIDDEIRVLQKAIWVFENVVHKGRVDRLPKLKRFRTRLEKASALKAKAEDGGRVGKESQSSQPHDMPETIPALCPHCRQILKKRPQRKKKCSHCGEYIYVRSVPSGDHHKVLVTEDGAKAIDQEWERVSSIERWMQTLERYELTAGDFAVHWETLRKRLGQEPRDSDVIWSLFNAVVRDSIKRADLGQLKSLYFDMALFLYEEGRGFLHLRRQAAKMELLRHKEWGTKEVEILAAPNSCQACKRLAGRVLTVDEALRLMPIPIDGCSHRMFNREEGWCRCEYLPVLD